MKDMKKYVSVIAAFIIVLSMIYSVFFISCNVHHDCSGENCPVCEQMQIAENVINKLSIAIVTIAIAISLCVPAQICRMVFSDTITYFSPIKLKVKMLN